MFERVHYYVLGDIQYDNLKYMCRYIWINLYTNINVGNMEKADNSLYDFFLFLLIFLFIKNYIHLKC